MMLVDEYIDEEDPRSTAKRQKLDPSIQSGIQQTLKDGSVLSMNLQHSYLIELLSFEIMAT